MAKDNKSQDPLFLNKLFAAIIGAVLLVAGLPHLAPALTGAGGHHGGHNDKLHLAYPEEDLELKKFTGGGGAKETAEVAVDLGTLLASASAERGAKASALCKSCHTFEQGGANGNGPNLWNIVNREVASVSGFKYQNALVEAGGVWSYDRLNEYLKDSKAYIPGTAMAQRIRKDNKRADILAYLGSLSDSPAAFPEPAPAETPAEEDGGH